MRIVGVISQGCGAVLDWAQGACEGKHSGETSMLRQLDAALFEGDVVLMMDRYYTGYFTLARLRALGVDFVSRQHPLRHMDFRQGKRFGQGRPCGVLEPPGASEVDDRRGVRGNTFES